MNLKIAAAAAFVLLIAACGNKEKKADALNDEVKAEICRLKDATAPIPASLDEDGRKAAVDLIVAELAERARKSPAVIAKAKAVNEVVKDFKPSDKFNYLFDVNRLDESAIRQIIEAKCAFDFVDDAVAADAETLPTTATSVPAPADGGFDEASMAAAEDAGIAAADQQAAYEAERLRAEADAARARKEALEAERALLAEQRRMQQQQLAQQAAQQQAAAAQRASCPYSMANPLRCASRDRQPTACGWDFAACGDPQLLKQESKTTCNGKMSADRGNDRIVVIDGCRGQFVPQS